MKSFESFEDDNSCGNMYKINEIHSEPFAVMELKDCFNCISNLNNKEIWRFGPWFHEWMKKCRSNSCHRLVFFWELNYAAEYVFKKKCLFWSIPTIRTQNHSQQFTVANGFVYLNKPILYGRQCTSTSLNTE